MVLYSAEMGWALPVYVHSHKGWTLLAKGFSVYYTFGKKQLKGFLWKGNSGSIMVGNLFSFFFSAKVSAAKGRENDFKSCLLGHLWILSFYVIAEWNSTENQVLVILWSPLCSVAIVPDKACFYSISGQKYKLSLGSYTVLHISKINSLLVKIIFKTLENHKILQDRAEPQRLTKMVFCHPAAPEGLSAPGILLKLRSLISLTSNYQARQI